MEPIPTASPQTPCAPPTRRPSMPNHGGWLAQAARVAAKDLHIEGRSREVLYTMGFLAGIVVLVFSFAFISGQEATVGPGVVAGILWVAVLFAGTVALSRTF